MGRAVCGARRSALLFFVVVALGQGSCHPVPAPREVDLAERLDEELREAGAPGLAPADYAAHSASLAGAREAVAREREKFVFFRDWVGIGERYRELVARERRLLARVAEIRGARSAALGERIEAERGRGSLLRELTTRMNEGRLARRSLTRAELALDDAERALASGDLDAGDAAVGRAESFHSAAERTLAPTVCRYLDSEQVARWRQYAKDAVAESARTGALALVVFKFERRLVVYRAGKAWRTYRVGLGMNGLSDKLFRGDSATPEGRYKVAGKLPGSRFHKALLIDYPNEEDRRRFAEAKRRGLVPAGRSIGGNVEIHGGGRDSVTEGCVSLDNPAMDELFEAVGVGTPVTVVGAVEVKDILTAACRKRM
jgi:hypothetical protein